MLSIDEINELKIRNEQLEKMIDRQTAQYNSLLSKYIEVMNITKTLWKRLNVNKTIGESLQDINTL